MEVDDEEEDASDGAAFDDDGSVTFSDDVNGARFVTHVRYQHTQQIQIQRQAQTTLQDYCMCLG